MKSKSWFSSQAGSVKRRSSLVGTAAGSASWPSALWVVDWYNYIVQHNPTPIGFETGKGNAYDTSLRDKTRGRIYRVVHREGTPSTQPVLDPSDPDTLLDGLTHDNKLWRLHAQRLLVERGKKDVIPELLGLVENPAVDALGLNPAAIRLLRANPVKVHMPV